MTLETGHIEVPKPSLHSDKIYIRASSLPSYADCARRTAAKMLQKDLEAMGIEFNYNPTGIGATIGTSTHEGANSILGTFISEGFLGNTNIAIDAAHNKFEEIRQSEEIVYDDITPSYDRASIQLKGLISSYREHIAPKIQPLQIELRLEVDLGDSFILSGQYDVREIKAIRDLKTGAVSRGNIAQYGAYAILNISHGNNIESLVEDYLPRSSSTKQPSFYYYDTQTAIISAKKILKQIKSDVAEFKATQNPFSFQANPQSTLCSDKFCPVWGTEFCKEHKPKAKND